MTHGHSCLGVLRYLLLPHEVSEPFHAVMLQGCLPAVRRIKRGNLVSFMRAELSLRGENSQMMPDIVGALVLSSHDASSAPRMFPLALTWSGVLAIIA